MKTLQDIKDRCRMEGDCWLWAGATSGGLPRIWAPDYTRHNGEDRSQMGRRAVWHIVRQRSIPAGWRVFGTCADPLCVNPAHAVCRSVKQQGELVAQSGKLKGSVPKILASRAIGRKRSQLTPELIQLIQTSPLTGVALCRETGLKRQLISKVRVHGARSFQPIASPFAGLGGRK